jgi:hypothetical protein
MITASRYSFTGRALFSSLQGTFSQEEGYNQDQEENSKQVMNSDISRVIV